MARTEDFCGKTELGRCKFPGRTAKTASGRRAGFSQARRDPSRQSYPSSLRASESWACNEWSRRASGVGAQLV